MNQLGVDGVEMIRLKEITFTFGNDECQSAEERVRDVISSLIMADEASVLIKGTSPQINMRKDITEWLHDVTGRLGLLRKTLFLGVYLFDRFCDRHDVAPQQIYLVALICLHLAAKLEENEREVPKMENMNRLLPVATDYSVDLYLRIEKLILSYFKFKLLYPTLVDFYEYFDLFALEWSELKATMDFNNNQVQDLYSKYLDFKDKIGKTSTEFMYLILGEARAGRTRQSLLAAASIMTSRIVVGLPAWSEKLEDVTCYAEDTVKACMLQFVPYLYISVTEPSIEYSVISRGATAC